MNTREYQNYKRMTKMTVRFLEKDGTITDSKSKLEPTSSAITTTTRATTPISIVTRATTPIPTTTISTSATNPILTKTTTSTTITTRATTPTPISTLLPSIETKSSSAMTTTKTTTTTSKFDFSKYDDLKLSSIKKEVTPTPDSKFNKINVSDFNVNDDSSLTTKLTQLSAQKNQKSSNGRYINWSSQHSTLASLSWCCIGDLMTFCDKYEYRTISRNDPQMHNRIVTEVKTLLNGPAPFDIRKRFPSDIHSPENLWVCIGRCTSVEYHLNRILSIFRRPLDKLSADKQRMVRHDFHLAINELRLDISARISEVRLYDQHIFEKNFNLEWQEETN